MPRQNSSQAVDPTLLDALEEDLSDTEEDPQSAMSQVIEFNESDRETVVASEMGAEAEEDPPTVQDEDVVFGEISQRVLREAFASLDSVNVEEDFVTRACVMKSPPRFLQGRIALSEADRARGEGHHGPSSSLEALLASPTNLALSSTPGWVRAEVPVVRTVPVVFCWTLGGLLEASRECANQAAVSSRRRRWRRDQGTSLQARADRAQTLIQMRVVCGSSRLGR